MVLLFTTIGGSAYWYYNHTQDTIIQLTENNIQLKENQSQLEEAVAKQTDTIDYLNNEYQIIRDDYDNAQSEMQIIRLDNSRLRERLGRHDLNFLAYSKPELVQRIINNASDNAMRCFEILSGSPLTDNERNAQNGQEFNSECPFLFDTYINN